MAEIKTFNTFSKDFSVDSSGSKLRPAIKDGDTLFFHGLNTSLHSHEIIALCNRIDQEKTTYHLRQESNIQTRSLIRFGPPIDGITHEGESDVVRLTGDRHGVYIDSNDPKKFQLLRGQLMLEAPNAHDLRDIENTVVQGISQLIEKGSTPQSETPFQLQAVVVSTDIGSAPKISYRLTRTDAEGHIKTIIVENRGNTLGSIGFYNEDMSGSISDKYLLNSARTTTNRRGTDSVEQVISDILDVYDDIQRHGITIPENGLQTAVYIDEFAKDKDMDGLRGFIDTLGVTKNSVAPVAEDVITQKENEIKQKQEAETQRIETAAREEEQKMERIQQLSTALSEAFDPDNNARRLGAPIEIIISSGTITMMIPDKNLPHFKSFPTIVSSDEELASFNRLLETYGIAFSPEALHEITDETLKSLRQPLPENMIAYLQNTIIENKKFKDELIDLFNNATDVQKDTIKTFVDLSSSTHYGLVIKAPYFYQGSGLRSIQRHDNAGNLVYVPGDGKPGAKIQDITIVSNNETKKITIQTSRRGYMGERITSSEEISFDLSCGIQVTQINSNGQREEEVLYFDPQHSDNVLRYCSESKTYHLDMISEMNNYTGVRKPVIYLYPTTEQQVSVRVDFKGEIVTTYPRIDAHNGWTVTATTEGVLRMGEKSYGYLFWDGVTKDASWDFSKGFCVHRERIDDFLEEKARLMGMNFREAQDFITYWAPAMKKNEWNLVSFQTERYEEVAKLMVDPRPDTLIRIFMVYKGVPSPIEIEAQHFTTPQRSGFTLVEWGGADADTQGLIG